MEKIFVFVAFICASVFCNGQEQPVSEISPVVVESNRKFFADDHTSITILPRGKPEVQNENIGYVLSKKSPLVIRNYGGYGSLTSVSMHGTGSNHTQLTWNGIPLNSPTTGQADLSLLPAGFIQQIEIVNGASGSLFGSGTFGGSVNLYTEADWNNRVNAHYTLQAGSFGRLSHLVNLQTGNSRIQYHLSLLSSRAENDFTFRDSYSAGNPLKINKNNKYSDVGILQNIYINAGKGHLAEAGMWYQRKLLGVPSIMGIDEESTARQKDSLLRLYLSYRLKTRQSALQVRSAFLSDYLNYLNGNDPESPSYINSEIQTSKLLNEADYRHFISDNMVAGAGISNSLIRGISGNYSHKIKEFETAVYLSLKYIYKDLIFNAGVRKEFYEGLNPLPQISAGVRYMPAKFLVVRATASTKFRKPSLNEKYWHPGGNPGLNPEKGRGGEISVEASLLDKPRRMVTARITTFYQVVDNWIQWIIRDSLTPVEYKKVHAGGLETWIDYSFSINSFLLKGFINYNFNRSVIKEVYDQNPYYSGRQMIYVPIHSAKSAVEVNFKNLMADLTINYNGRRETAETGDAALELDPYLLLDASFSYSRNIGSVPVQIGMQCDNLFGTRYEIIRSYPVPGRTFRFVITLGYQRNSEKVNTNP